nr:MAG TPA: hypothetical protein [Caudoviricetes sp.]
MFLKNIIFTTLTYYVSYDILMVQERWLSCLKS